MQLGSKVNIDLLALRSLRIPMALGCGVHVWCLVLLFSGVRRTWSTAKEDNVIREGAGRTSTSTSSSSSTTRPPSSSSSGPSWMPASPSSSSPPPQVDAPLRAWTEDEITMYKAEMWGDVQWNPTDIAFTTWDENISMALQEEELERLTGGSVESPAATCVPVPSQLLAGEQPATPGCNWWELIQDKRRLRGHRDHSGASSSTDLPTEGSGITSRETFKPMIPQQLATTLVELQGTLRKVRARLTPPGRLASIGMGNGNLVSAPLKSNVSTLGGEDRREASADRTAWTFKGLWRPAWLEKYRQERDARQAPSLPRVQENEENIEETSAVGEENDEQNDDQQEQTTEEWTSQATSWTGWTWHGDSVGWSSGYHTATSWNWDGHWNVSNSGTENEDTHTTWTQDHTGPATAEHDPWSEPWSYAPNWATSSSSSTTSSSTWAPVLVSASCGARCTSTTSTSSAFFKFERTNFEAWEIGANVETSNPFPYAWERDSWRHTLTTSTTTRGDLLPNEGLFPIVRPARLRLDGDETGLMRITNSEIALMEEHGAGRHHIRRIADLLEALDTEQVEGRGPEARWSIARLMQRVTDAQETINATMRVLNRRLRPRGVLPIQRVPRPETERWRRFMWGRQFAGIFRDCLETNLMTPLQHGEDADAVGASSSSSPVRPVGTRNESHGSPPTTTRARSRSRSRSLSSHGRVSSDAQDCDSEFAWDSEGELVHLSDAEPGAVAAGPPQPLPANLVTLEPVGIWRELDETEDSINAPVSSTSTTTSITADGETDVDGLLTSTTSTTDWDANMGRVATRLTLTHSLCLSVHYIHACLMHYLDLLHFLDELLYLLPLVCRGCQGECRGVQLGGAPRQHPGEDTYLGMVVDLYYLEELFERVMLAMVSHYRLDNTTTSTKALAFAGTWWLPPTTTTSTSSLLTSAVWPSDIVRDSVNVNLIHGGTADVVQLVHTLLARQRHLRHVDRLITDAISEALTWVPVSLNSEAMNAGTYVDQIWRTITREASFGSNQTSTSPSQIAAAPSVLLQPGFPSTWEEIQYMLPNVSVQVAGGYRRRAWRGAVEQAIGVHHEEWRDPRIRYEIFRDDIVDRGGVDTAFRDRGQGGLAVEKRL
eukprot:s2153_g4.t1